MIRLTLRSGLDGRFLARVVARRDRRFVLDFGDERLVADVSEKLARGFSTLRHGSLVAVAPSDPDILIQLAEYYLREGVLVVYEEPNWPRGVSHDHSQGPTRSS
ncbi:MAG: hypothetical protein ACON5B_01235 [Myxococcota bacterium]